MSRLVSVVLCALAGLVVAIFMLPSTGAAAVVPSSESLHLYADDGDHAAASLPHILSERGPPAALNTNVTDTAVNPPLYGLLARPDAAAVVAYAYAYDDPWQLVQAVDIARTTSEIAPRAQRTSALATRSQVAANTGVGSGLPRDAFGRFTSGAGGESAAAAAGRSAHANYANTLGGGNYVFNRELPGSKLRPDAVDYSQNIVRELKPGTPSGISRGWRQVNGYKAYLEELTGQPWTAYVDVYTP